MMSTLGFDGYKGDPVMLPCNMSRSQGSNGDCMDHVQRGRERVRKEAVIIPNGMMSPSKVPSEVKRRSRGGAELGERSEKATYPWPC